MQQYYRIQFLYFMLIMLGIFIIFITLLAAIKNGFLVMDSS